MGWKTCVAVGAALAVMLAAWPDDADAATKKRARIVVQKRSYLDAGTEVLPGTRKYTDYAFPIFRQSPYSSGFEFYGPPNGRYPLPDPFWLPGGARY
jgi:hypothetical protein